MVAEYWLLHESELWHTLVVYMSMTELMKSNLSPVMNPETFSLEGYLVVKLIVRIT
uniref:Uncharacterized protein n=1 Tax=Arundo donax TaxID=35708 RepID=A0A0A9ADQ2_ARUDO